MIVWEFPCESRSLPGFNSKNPTLWSGFFCLKYFTEAWIWCEFWSIHSVYAVKIEQEVAVEESRVLSLHTLPGLVSYFEPIQEFPVRVKEHSPAILVMTDFRQQVAVTVEPNVSIEWALQRMKAMGVRLLFVVDGQKHILGLITSTDVLGEKPLQFHQQLHIRYEEIMVRDIMTPQNALEVLQVDEVLRSSVGDIVATLQNVGRRHALVLDDDPRTGLAAIRGIFSATQISTQLEQLIETNHVAHTFAEVEMALHS